MSRFPIILAFIGLILIQTEPAFSAVTRTLTLLVSATLPEHIMTNSLNIAPISNTNQLIQTDTVIRNNKSVRLTTIVVP
ncbi:MAG: hypothetical protein HQL14_00030 [Candidatus Omnitrophica bacterium]|nr:hypothetical protein [Candidatus Omnitrophota bacterium]